MVNDTAFNRESHPAPIVLQFHFEEEDYPPLLSLSSLLYDLEIAHDLSVMLSFSQYTDARFATPYFFFRNGRSLAPEHRARAARVIKNSPLFLEVVVAAVGGIWILIQILDKVSTWKLNREKLRLEIEKLRYETDLKQLELADNLSRRPQSDEVYRVQQQLVSRLERSDFRLTDLTVRTLGDPETPHLPVERGGDV